MDDSSKHDQSNKEFMKAEILSPTVSEQQPQDTPSPAVHSQPISTKSENDSFCFSCMSSPQKEDVDMKSQGHDYKTQILEYFKTIKDGSGYRYGVNSVLGYLMKFDGNYNHGSWSKIAELLVATKDNSILKYCLGYAASILNDWMKVQHGDNAQGCDDVSELFMLAFLEALEKLPSDDQTFNACSIKQIVKELCAHRNVDIQRKARCVLEVWKSLGVQSIKSDKCEGGASLQAHIEKCGTYVDSSCLGSSKDNALLVEDKLAKVVGPEIIHGTTGDGDSKRGYTESSLSNSSCPEAEVCQTSLKDATKGYIPTCFIAETGDKKITVEERAESLESSDPCSVKLNLPPSCNTVEEKSIEHFDKQFSIAGSGSVTTSMVSSLNSSVSEAKPNCNSTKVVDNSSRLVSGSREPVSSSVLFEGDERACSGEETSGTSSSLGNHEGTGPSVGDLKFRSHFKHSASMYNTNELCGRLDDSCNTEKQSFSNHSKSEEESRGGDSDLGYVEDDALEVARQVAKEVEMEVESSLSSEKHAGSEQMQSGTTYSARQKQDVFLSNECNEKEESQEHASVVPLLTPDGTISEVQDTKRDSLVQQNSEQVVTKLRETAQESESCKMTMTSQESITVESSAKMSNAVENKEGRRCVFDLNEDIVTEGGEDLHQLTHAPAAVSIASSCNIGTVSAPIPVVAVSKSSFDISVSPLHFEGELGWRGSAVTSAFRPAWRASEAAPSNEEISPRKAENTAFEFDLNAPCDDGSGSGSGNRDISFKENCGERPVPASAGIASCDSSIEVSSSRRAERLTWDLNRVDGSDDSDPVALCGWRNADRLGKVQKLDFGSSPTSSCRPAAQVFDLNEDPPTEDVSTSAYGNTHIDYHKNAHSDNFVFSLMGSKINIDVTKLPSAQPKTDKDGAGLPLRHPNLAATWNNSYGIGEREFPNPAQPFFVSGPTAVSSLSANMGRTFPVSSALTFSTSTMAIPYNGLAFGPSYLHHINPCSASAPLQCMIDTVGPTVPPHLIPSVHVSPSFARLPFTADSTTNRASLDLNTGSSAFESECNDIGGSTKYMFPSSNHILPDEQLRTFHQPTSSRSPLKRKEPGAPWDSYRLDHNHHSSSWR